MQQKNKPIKYMDFEQQKKQIQEMINDGQKRVEDITNKYTNYIKQNKQISVELEQLVGKLKECTGNLGKIGEAYQRSKQETKKSRTRFATRFTYCENKHFVLWSRILFGTLEM